MTPLQRLSSQARRAVLDDDTISHELARDIAQFLAEDTDDEDARDFAIRGIVPRGHRRMIEMHQALCFGLHNEVSTAMARYLRERRRNGLTGEFFLWELLISTLSRSA